MMISPRSYVDEHRNDSIKKLIKERKSLIKEIEKLEKIVFSKEKSSEEWDFRPSPDVRYQMTLEYLAELCKFISERYNDEYVWGTQED